MILCVGIDPGTATGYAEWRTDLRKLVRVESMSMYEAQAQIRAQKAIWTEEGQVHLLVVLEDARRGRVSPKAKTFGQVTRLQGVGGVKRESALWVEFLEAEGIPYTTVPPRRRATKKDAALFKSITGWDGRTNEHGRDAGMFVFGMHEGAWRVAIQRQQRGEA